MSKGRPSEAVAGPVDQFWLDETSPWLGEENPPALTVLPDRIVNGKAVFNADIAPLVKQIRSQGYDARFLATPSQTFQSEYGADSVIVLSFLLNVASNASWDSFKFLLHTIRLRVQGVRQTGAEPQVTLTQGIFRHPDGSSYLWQQFSGTPERVLELAESAVKAYVSANPGTASSVVEPKAQPGQSSWAVPE